jgi:hypothetical protein
MVMKLASPTRAQAISTSVDRNTLNDGAFERGSRSASGRPAGTRDNGL